MRIVNEHFSLHYHRHVCTKVYKLIKYNFLYIGLNLKFFEYIEKYKAKEKKNTLRNVTVWPIFYKEHDFMSFGENTSCRPRFFFHIFIDL